MNSFIDPLTMSIKAAQDKKINDSRDFFEQLITDFPTCGRYWRIYIEQELKGRNFDRVEKLFQRSLMNCLNIELWKCYLNYVRDTKSKMSNYKEKMAQAYDFALDKIGLDVNSCSIWMDYVNFLKSVDAAGSYAENQKITAIRKVYQKGVLNPMINVDQLWKDYCVFENQINVHIAKRMIDDRSREFTIVRKISKDYENVTRYLDRNMPALPPQSTNDESKQKTLWKRYIEWEKGNPLRNETDHSVVVKRVMFAYDQCLLHFATHPDIYYEAANYLQQQSAQMAEKCDLQMSKFFAEEAINMYERAIKSFMKNNMLLYFAYADFEEVIISFHINTFILLFIL
jgi:cleavage stimulation factor subunit 3